MTGDLPPSAGQPREQNTLYAGTGNPGEAQPVELIYRVYVPDKNRDLAGDGGLPEPAVLLADGTQLVRPGGVRRAADQHELPVPRHHGAGDVQHADHPARRTAHVPAR